MAIPGAVLPRPLDPFIGRAAELEAVKTLLATHRLVTLTGPAGIGKTRLALRLAEELATSFADGVGFVRLVGLTDPARIPQLVAAALGLREEPDRPLQETLVNFLSRRTLLLVWDNCDRVVDGCRSLAEALLNDCPQVRILATSRRSLRAYGEVLRAVPPFGFPESRCATREAGALAELVAAHEALTFFEQRAREKLADFGITPENVAAVTQICRRLDGIPLALELAAGRVRELTVEQIAARLDERFRLLIGGSTPVTHQQTLEAAIGWTYDLLSEPERALLARLSVFAGGWTLEAAEAVCGDRTAASERAPAPMPHGSPDVLELLTGLIDKSWIIGETRHGARRFRFLETVRQFNQERLREVSGEGALQQRHADYYLTLAETAERELGGDAPGAFLDRLETEHENFRAALVWYRELEEGAERELRLAAALRPYWETRGYISEGADALAQALGREGADRPTPARASALGGAGMLAWMQGDHPRAEARLEESLAVQKALEDRRGIARTVHQLGQVAYAQGDYDAARSRFEEGRTLQTETPGLAWSLHELARVAQVQGDYETAARLHQQSLGLFREQGNQPGTAFSLVAQGNLACAQGRFAPAEPLFEESLAIFRAMGNKVGIAISLNRLGKVAREQGKAKRAAELHAEGLEIRRELDDRVGVAWSLEAFALLAAPAAPERAATLWGAAETLRQTHGSPLPPEEREEYDRSRAGAREALGEQRFTGAWETGRAMSLEQAIRFALRDAAGPAAGVPAFTILASKLAPPVLPPNLLPRPRLAARLDAAPPARLALVVAPAGSGKSSLLSHWCREQEERSVAWLSVDADDGDPARFITYLGAAFEKVAPAAIAPLHALLRSAEPAALQRALSLLLNGLATLEQPKALVLDDYHAIESPAVHEMVAFLVEHLPPTVFLILATRSDPPLPLARLRVRGWLVEIRAGELRFTPAEAGRFLRESMHLALPPEVAAGLTERTEGWIAGLQLAALSLQGHPDPGRFLESFTGSHRFILDYLFEEVLERQPPEVQAFLYRTAILERLCGPLCEAVAGAAEPGRPAGWGQAMLDRLEAASLFLTPLDTERQWYRYHPLFAEVLRARLLPEHAEETAALHQRATAWFEEAGMRPEAIDHALAGRQFESAAHLLEEQVAGAWLPPERRLLERWLKALPPSLLQARPALSRALAGVHIAYYRAAEAAKILDDCVFEAADNTPATRELQGKLLLARAGAARLMADPERAVDLTRQALSIFPSGSYPLRSPALLHLGILEEARGELSDAQAHLSAALAEAHQCNARNVRLRAGYACGQLLQSRGALNEADSLYRDALEYAAQQGYSHTAAAGLIYAGLGGISYQRNDLVAAADYLTEGIQRTASAAVDIAPIHAVPCLFGMLRVHTALGESEQAESVFARLEQITRATPVPCLDPLLAALQTRRKGTHAEAASEWLREFDARSNPTAALAIAIPDLCVPDIRGLEILTWAQLRAAESTGNGPSVRIRLHQLLDALTRPGRHGTALEVRLVLAARYWQAGDREAALAVLEPALILAAREGYGRAFVEAGPSLIPMLRQAAVRGVVPEYVGELLALLELPSRPSAIPSQGLRERPAVRTRTLVEPLSERELEVLRLIAAGLSNKEIADQLFIGVGTVKQHLHHINGKLEATSRTSAVARARELSLL